MFILTLRPQGLFATLVLVFWIAIILSAYCHTLHPHIFYHDSDSEDERWQRTMKEHGYEFADEESEFSDEEDQAQARSMLRRQAPSSSRSTSRGKPRRGSRARRGSTTASTTVIDPYEVAHAQPMSRRSGFVEEDEDDGWIASSASAPNSRPASRPSSRNASPARGMTPVAGARRDRWTDDEFDTIDDEQALIGMDSQLRRSVSGRK